MMNVSVGAVLVSGACGLLGSSVVDKALKLGRPVLAVDINQVALKNLEARYDSSILSCLVGDVCSESGIEALDDFISNSGFFVSSAVHCAYPRSLWWGATLEQLQANHLFDDLSAQLGGSILFSRSILEYFKAREGGSLVHISSIQGVSAHKFEHYRGTPMNSPVEYAAIKAGVISITRWLAKYYSGFGIRVNCVSPGGIYAGQHESFVANYRGSCSNIGLLSPCHVADAVMFLMSAEAAPINGQNFVVDDGWTL